MRDNRPLEDWEYPDSDDHDDDEIDLRRCPACGEEYYEESEACPYCGEYYVPSRTPLVDRPWWQLALGLAGLAAVIWTLLRGG